MLERFAAQVLNRYIGQYVENFNPGKLSIGVVQGAVELEDLHLRKDALKEFDLPGIEVKWGSIGKISLRIPSYRSYSEPWIIEINKLYLIVRPIKHDNSTVDDDTDKQRKEESKTRQLAALEEKWNATQGSSKSMYAIWHSYSSSIITNIVENLQVHLHDLHIRYEDDVTLPDTFSCGIHVDVLSTQTTNENWEAKPSQLPGVDKKWKKMKLQDMSFYWDTKSKILGDLDHSDLMIAMENASNASEKKQSANSNGHNFIVCPVSGEVHLTRNCSSFPIRSKHKPRLSLDVELPTIPLCLNKTQYQQVSVLLNEIARWGTRAKHKSGRPVETITENPKLWWKWAMDIELKKIQTQRLRKTLKFLCNRVKVVVQYVKTYRKYLHQKYVLKSQANDLVSQVKELEEDLNFSELRILREIVYSQINEENEIKRKAEQATKSKIRRFLKGTSTRKKTNPGLAWRWVGWIGKWGNNSSGSNKDEIENNQNIEENREEVENLESLEKEMSDLLPNNEDSTLHESVFKDLDDDEIYEMFGEDLADQHTTDTFLKRDALLLKLNFTLNTGSFTLMSSESSTSGIVMLEFNNVKVDSEWRPRYGTHEIQMKLGGIILKDLDSNNKHFSHLVRPLSMKKQKPTSPTINLPGSYNRNFTDVFNTLFQYGKNNENVINENNEVPVFSLTYEKLPENDNTMFSNVLQIVTAPLALTFLPGLLDRLKSFFKSYNQRSRDLQAVDSELLISVAREKYEAWLIQTRAEVTNTVRRLIEGKQTTKVNKDRWAVSLDIFAPEITIPQDWSSPNTPVAIVNLGHMTFENHTQGVFNKLKSSGVSLLPDRSSSEEGEEEEDYNSDDDDFMTPPGTPILVKEETTPTLATTKEKSSPSLSSHSSPNSSKEEEFDHQQLSKRMLREKMYDRYHLHFADLQVLIAPDYSVSEILKTGDREKYHLVKQFSVDLTVERRVVSTVDPEYPSLVVNGNLPDLTLRISHNKIETAMKCLHQFSSKPNSEKKTNQPSQTKLSVKNLLSPTTQYNPNYNKERAQSKQLACDFSINKISIVLEFDDLGTILSVFEISGIQSSFVQRRFDSTTSLSIYNLLLIDVMQQLGQDYELLLASHRGVFMDVGSGHMLDSGTTSPDPNKHFNKGASSPQLLRSASEIIQTTSKTTLPVPNSQTSNVLKTVADNLSNIPGSPTENKNSKFEDVLNEASKHLICLEIKSLKEGSPDLTQDENCGSSENKSHKSPCNIISGNFNVLDVVFNAQSWITILNFLHKLKPTNTNDQDSINKNNDSHLKAIQSQKNVKNEDDKKVETHIEIDLKKLNILLLRHIQHNENTVGRKVATLTMLGAHVVADLNSKNVVENGLIPDVNVVGSVASLRMQNLTSDVRDLSGKCMGLEILNVGSYSEDNSIFSAHASPIENTKQTKAFSFLFQRLSTSLNAKPDVKYVFTSESEPLVTKMKKQDLLTSKSFKDENDLVFDMDNIDKSSEKQASTNEMKLQINLASACYIHSPRLIAEMLALIDEVGDFTNAQMTTATKQAYKDMARSILDKVSNSMVMLGKSMVNLDESVEEGELETTLEQNNKTNFQPFYFQLEMETPIVAIPKFPGSFELLVANLGQIIVKNYPDKSCGGPFDKLSIDIVNMNLRSHRQKQVELAAKQADSDALLSCGPSITELKRTSLHFMTNSMPKDNNKEEHTDIEILHKTTLQLSINKIDYIPNKIKELDGRKCCDKSKLLNDSSCCEEFNSCLGAINDKRMCVTIHASSSITVTLSKHAYEQVLKTLDNLAYGGDIDDIQDQDEEDEILGGSGSFLNTEVKLRPAHSASAPVLLDVAGSSKKKRNDRLSNISSVSSHHSTPRSNREFGIFEAPGLTCIPPNSPTPTKLQLPPQLRKYTPMSANFNVQSLIFQLSEDLSEGEQGIVKVTLQEFSGAYEKENRFGTSFDLSLGSIDIEDLLQDINSPHRHIVVSSFPGQTQAPKPTQKTDYLSTSCPAFPTSQPSNINMSTSLPSQSCTGVNNLINGGQRLGNNGGGVFRPYANVPYTSGMENLMSSTQNQPPTKPNQSSSALNSSQEEQFSPTTPPKEQKERTLVHIKVFLVDGKSQAYKKVYDRVNRRIAIDFNSLDCKINLQTWVVLLDFFGIGTSPKKTFQLDRETEETFSWDQRLDIRSFYENQPQEHINSEIDFKVRCFNIICNKQEYELLKANVTGLKSHVTLRDGTLQVAGQLGNVSVSDLSPNGNLYKERFIFTGDKALDFDIKKYDEYDHLLQRDFDISIRLRMSSIRYVHTQRFQNETVAFFQHFQQLQEVLGRMRAASVGQSVRTSSCRQARVLLDIETDAPIILIPECSHAERLIVANLGHIRVKNSFKRDGDKETLSYGTKRIVEPELSPKRSVEIKSIYVSEELIDISPQPESRCILDVIQVTLDDMDLFTATYASNNVLKESDTCLTSLVFPSYTVTCHAKPLLKEKAMLKLQMERNLEKEITHQGVPDTSLSARLSTVYCAIDHTQYWLIRGVLDHNTGEAIPDFPQPTASLQPSKLQTVLTGSVYTGLSVDFDLTNVSIELLEQHETISQPAKSLGRIDFVKSILSYRAFSNNIKTTNLSCESFRAHNTRWSEESEYDYNTPPSVFTTVLGPVKKKGDPNKNMNTSGGEKSLLQFEIFQRSGPGLMEMTALLNNMRVYVIVNWLLDTNKYLIENPNQKRCDSLRAKTAQLMAKYGQQDSGNQRGLDKSGQLEPEVRKNIFKMSFTDTEFVMVEDCTSYDTDGVILRSTALLNFAPDGAGGNDLSDLPLRCSLQSLEVFSCQLDKENETALSIIDPLTINLEVRPLKQKDLTQDQIDQDLTLLDRNLLDVHMTELNMRVSYNDVMLFLSILKSLPSQARGQKPMSTSSSTSSINSLHGSSSSNHRAIHQPPEEAIERLVELGYSRSDVVHALTINSGNVSNSGSWLVANATLQPFVKEIKNQPTLKKPVPLNIAKLSLMVDHARICLIDDCAEDCDVPLTEIAVHRLNVNQNLAKHTITSMVELLHGQYGYASFKLTGDYYNRMRSLWEPFLEPWKCGLNWNHELRTRNGSNFDASNNGNWNLQLKAFDRFDVSVTSTLIETVKMTGNTWRHHYAKVNDPISVKQKKRQPFVPYILRNLTGCLLQFATQTSAQVDQFSTGSKKATSDNSEQGKWVEVYPGDQQTFHFATIHEKRRHDRTASLKLHQIKVQLGKWKTLQPVTISKVGVYFRHTYKQINTSSNIYESSVPVRVVFSVTLEGSAQKVVTIRSALAVRSRVKIPVQLRLDCGENVGSQTMPILLPGETQYVPIEMTSCSIRICPRCKITGPYHYSTTSIIWKDMPKHKTVQSEIIDCIPSTNQLERPPFYFAVSIHRKPYPTLGEIQEQADTSSSEQLPGHTIIILPPLVISNLLPSDLQYYIRDTLVNGTLKPGVDATPHHVYVSPSDDLSPLTLGCLVDGFISCKEVVIPSVVQNSQMRMMLGDYENRTLILNVRILWRLDCSVKVSIMAGYWIVNKTGLPIIVKQEGCQKLAAGQHRAHEQARSLQPLMFSYTDRNEPYLCTMRLGREVRMDDLFKERNTAGKAIFCENFSTDGGSCTRNLKVITNDNTPAREFYIGISVRRGWGRYLHTHIVTIAPRFLLINKTKARKLSFAQRHTISYTSDAYGTNCHLTTMPGSSAVFHWPRVDLDTLLCVKLADESTCHWSGGFFIDRTDAFHVQLRIAAGSHRLTVGELHPLSPHCVFLSIEVTLVDATYCICVSDADPNIVPPPLRVDNMSSAPIIFKQVGTEEGYNTEVPAESRLAYACDEPCLPHHIQCNVRGGSSSARLDMSNIGTEKELFYENYIYITIGTPVLQKSVFGHSNHTAVVLVLEVQGDHRSNIISLQPLRSSKRSQLWRMTADGKIFHEGSSPPEKEMSTSDGAAHRRRRAPRMVLDISEMAFNMGSIEGIPLALRAEDERRRSTQTWSFSEGRLKCRHKNLCVQTNYLEVGGIVKLASFEEHRVILPHESCSRHKLIPGSGMLSLKVVRDGPTRVLRIVDIRQKRAGIDMKHSDWSMVESKPEKHFAKDSSGTNSSNQHSSLRFNLTVSMVKGLGVSLVSNTPEELIYLTMNGVHMEISVMPGEETFLLRVQKIQIDNQLLDGYPQVMLSPIYSAKTPNPMLIDHLSSSTDPLLSVHAVRQPTNSKMYQIYKSLVVDVGKLSLEIEERLLLKLLHFAGVGPSSSQGDSELLDETKVELNRTVAMTTKDFSSTRRYYFDTLKLAAAPLRLSVITASRLLPELNAVKRALGIMLIQFERAPINLQAYLKRHLFETFAFIIADFTKHIKDQLKSQAARILGSVDFLGNPIGLLSDVKAGVSGLARGNVHNMVKHLTHGLSDSTAKVAGTLSDRLGAIAMDQEHDEKRKAIQAHSRDAGSHVLAGLQGLMTGVIGGFTSVVTQTVKGVQDDGAKGFITGIGKGVVGTVTKPVSGILDLASQSASAVREISLSKDRQLSRVRPIRCCHSFQGCLQCYSASQANGQQFLYTFNRNDYTEHFYALHKLSYHQQDSMMVLITNKKVYFVKESSPEIDHVQLFADYAHLMSVNVIMRSDVTESGMTSQAINEKPQLELVIKLPLNSGQFAYQPETSGTSAIRYKYTKPRVTCHSRDVAEKACQQINYAMSLASEQTETLDCDPDEEEAEDKAFDFDV